MDDQDLYIPLIDDHNPCRFILRRTFQDPGFLQTFLMRCLNDPFIDLGDLIDRSKYDVNSISVMHWNINNILMHTRITWILWLDIQVWRKDNPKD